jgi:hypothetical protein
MKPRNPVALPASVRGGAGKHRNKKKDAKNGVSKNARFVC